MSEHLLGLGCACLFATHFPQLAELADVYPNCRQVVRVVGLVWALQAAEGGSGSSGSAEGDRGGCLVGLAALSRFQCSMAGRWNCCMS